MSQSGQQQLPVSFAEWEYRARGGLPKGPFDYIAGGAGTEDTIRMNRESFQGWRLQPKFLRDVSKRDTRVVLFGQTYPAPVLLAPISIQGIANPQGELATARAAAALGVSFTLSTVSSRPIEEVAPDGLIVSSPGTKVNEQNNAMSAWQNTLVPPKPPITADTATLKLGRDVFQRASCIKCHAGDFYTNNRIVPAPEIGTDPSRAQALKATEKIWGEATIYSPDTPVPVPPNAKDLKVPTDLLDPGQINLAFAKGSSPGGYKTPSLIGLYWTAPYLHDGGVIVGPEAKKQLGFPGTLVKGIQPDPANSLRALVDKKLREKVIDANRSANLQQVHVQGIGHEYWVDETTGFTAEE